MRAGHAQACGTVLGFLGDRLAGDPARGHPVAAFGRAAAAIERRLTYRDHRGAGAVHAALCLGAVTAAAAAAARATGSVKGAHRAHHTHRARSPHGPRSAEHAGAPAVVLTAAVTWAALGGTSLAREAEAIGEALRSGATEAARERLPHLCGRDPQSLDPQGIARAVVESVAENTSDAVVGALVWGAAAGVPGIAGFRAVNTLDAMVGHLSPAYRRFGWASARLDDLAGWPGARLTAALATLAGPDPRGAVRVWRSDAHRHPSPNAGPVEAAFAGALGVRLGGTLAYGGRVERRPVLNPAGREVVPADIARAVRLSRRVGVLALAVTLAARAAAGIAGAHGTTRATGSGSGSGGTNGAGRRGTGRNR